MFSQNKESKNDLSNLFLEIKVTKSNSPVSADLKDSKEISIILTKHIDAEKLPYADTEQLGEAYLKSIGARRFNNCMIVARGDTRSPKEIFEVGGFHPKFTAPGSVAKSEIKDVLDVVSHRGATEGSGLVSYTVDPSIARSFGSDEGGYFYLAKATGAVGPSEQDFYKKEKEYSVPGGVDAEDIVAVRKVKQGEAGSFEESIFISKAFIEKYPERVPEVIHACLALNEQAVFDNLVGLDAKKVESEVSSIHAKYLEELKSQPKQQVAEKKQTMTVETCFQLLKKIIEDNALKMQPRTALSRGFYQAKQLLSSTPSASENKNISKAALTIQTVHGICSKELKTPDKLALLASSIEKKISELQLKKFNGKLYDGCPKNNSELTLSDLKTKMADQYKFVIAVHLALQKGPDNFGSELMKNLKEIPGFDLSGLSPPEPSAGKTLTGS
jgi:hypothetical protein